MPMVDKDDPLGIGGKLDMALDDVIERGSTGSTGKSRGKGGKKGQSESGEVISARVFVGNLAYCVTWQELKDHMRQAGNVVHCDIIPQPGTALGSKGCGIVEFASTGEAKKAIDTLRDTDLKGRPIFLREDREEKHTFARTSGLSREATSMRPHASSGRRRRRSRSSSSSQSRSRSRGRRRRSSRTSGSSGSTSVYVGNLAFSATWQDLKDHMRQAGDVIHCDIMADRGTPNGSKGCGLVEFASASDARRAIRDLQDTELKGRLIFVREDRDAGKGKGKGKGKSEGGRSKGSGEVGRRVFVGNLAYSVTWQELKDVMREAGDVIFCDIMAQPGTACGSKGCGIVEFGRRSDAMRAIKTLSEREMRGRNIFVREDRDD